MIIVMKAGAAQEHIDRVFEKVQELGFRVHPIYGELRTVIACVGDERGKYRLQALETLDGVENVVPILKPFIIRPQEYWQDGKARMENFMITIFYMLTAWLFITIWFRRIK